ncbi:hypothetical protein V8G54_032736 [Vigna mungo]|uniref:Uncharacterized protein n=1 Tax=Vigna mungo TaxID=3915 RepID=A0AAQ3RFK4_VIGMU
MLKNFHVKKKQGLAFARIKKEAIRLRPRGREIGGTEGKGKDQSLTSKTLRRWQRCIWVGWNCPMRLVWTWQKGCRTRRSRNSREGGGCGGVRTEAWRQRRRRRRHLRGSPHLRDRRRRCRPC